MKNISNYPHYKYSYYKINKRAHLFFLKSSSFFISGTKSVVAIYINPPSVNVSKNVTAFSMLFEMIYSTMPPKTTVSATT